MAERHLTELRVLVVSSGSLDVCTLLDALDGSISRSRVAVAEGRTAFAKALQSFGPSAVVFDNDCAPFETGEALRLLQEFSVKRHSCPHPCSSSR